MVLCLGCEIEKFLCFLFFDKSFVLEADSQICLGSYLLAFTKVHSFETSKMQVDYNTCSL